MANPYETDLDKNDANFTPLSPLSFIRRTASTYPNRTAVIHGNIRRNWAETYARARQLASALSQRGIGLGDCVAVMAPNIPEMMEAHFGIPMTGGIINAINTRLDAATVAFILDHGEAKILLTDTEFAPVIKEALELVETKPLVVDICDSEGPGGEQLGDIDYETFIAGGDAGFEWSLPDDEWRAIALNYTSGTTGNPKGVVYHHRGAYLNAMGNVFTWGATHNPIYLWTLPMFHCNGWCFTWGVALVAGTHVCLRQVAAKNIYAAFAEHGVTHLCGAPIVMQMIVNASEEDRQPFEQSIEFMTAAAPPPAAVLARMAEEGIRVTHVYGLTEIYGPAVVCAWQDEWDELPPEQQAQLQSRQGVPYEVLEDVMVGDPDTLEPVPRDGETMGEVFTRGNVTMKGYLKNPTATDDAFAGGWFHTGDLGVWHADNYIELKDRSKDIIISGGENISSIEVEDALYKHPAVSAAAVVARPDEKWGETPCAFIELAPDTSATAEELIQHCRDHLAHYKCPRHIVFGGLPKTSTGKIQKFVLREEANKLANAEAAAE
ncbi:MAG: acyl-CoA synthetase [Alphaproteobacteria bacterium]|nr:acyl-CoA synthetase [Alphaproteobacteria bacterium]